MSQIFDYIFKYLSANSDLVIGYDSSEFYSIMHQKFEYLIKSFYPEASPKIFRAEPKTTELPLSNFCQNHPIDAVFSSVFETKVGRKATLQLTTELQPNL